jgi:hypothetical protein
MARPVATLRPAKNTVPERFTWPVSPTAIGSNAAIWAHGRI